MNEIIENILNRNYTTLQNYKYQNKEVKDFVLLGVDILKIIKKYRKDCDDLHNRIGKTEGALQTFAQAIVLSKSTFFSNPMHDDYFINLDKKHTKLMKIIERVDDSEIVSAMADAIITDLTKPANKIEEKYVRTNYDADDNMFPELIQYLSNETLNKVANDFIVERKINHILPNQQKLIKNIKEELKKRNLTIPKRKFLF